MAHQLPGKSELSQQEVFSIQNGHPVQVPHKNVSKSFPQSATPDCTSLPALGVEVEESIIEDSASSFCPLFEATSLVFFKAAILKGDCDVGREKD